MTATRHTISSARGRARPGFTIIELLVVVAIIFVLLGLITGVGIVVVRNQQAGATRNVLMALDRALDEYMLNSGGQPPRYRYEDYLLTPGPEVTAGSPGRAGYFGIYPAGGALHPRRPDAAVFIRQARGTGEVDAIINGIGDRFLRVTTTPAGTSPDIPGDSVNVSGSARDRDTTPSVVDTWSKEDWSSPWRLAEQQLIYYIHPSNLLAQELYGRCLNGRPYFMSAGPDRRYGLSMESDPIAPRSEVEGWLDDNLYSYTPGPAARTQDFFDNHR